VVLLFSRQLWAVSILCLSTGIPALAQQNMALPRDCANLDFSTTGRTVMFPARDGIAFGISVERDSFAQNEPIPIHVWIRNQTDREWSFGSCALFFDWGVDVIDIAGNRMTGSIKYDRCVANAVYSVPAHTCVGPDLNLDLPPFDLAPFADPFPPGRYLLVERRENMTPEPHFGLWIRITDD